MRGGRGRSLRLLAGLARLITGVEARWVGSAPSTRQRVYFANHTSHLDAVVLWAALPGPVRARTRPVATRDYWGSNRLRRYLAEGVLGAVLIDRHGGSARANPIEARLAELGERDSAILFPEGTRGRGPEPAPFKCGLYHLARKRPEIELVPVYLAGLNRVLPKGEFLPIPLPCRVTFGPAVKPEPGEPKAAFLERARLAVWRLSAC